MVTHQFPSNGNDDCAAAPIVSATDNTAAIMLLMLFILLLIGHGALSTLSVRGRRCKSFLFDILEAYAKERGVDRGDLFSLAIYGGYVKRAFNDWSEKVATLVDDPDLIDWPLEDPLTCMAIAFMRHLAIQTVKKWREKAGSDDDQADWWKGEVSE